MSISGNWYYLRLRLVTVLAGHELPPTCAGASLRQPLLEGVFGVPVPALLFSIEAR
jgi:hypothetical protein